MPPGLDVKLHPGGICGCSDLVGHPVRVPRPDMRRVVGEQVRVISQLDTDSGKAAPARTGYRTCKKDGQDQDTHPHPAGEP